jgi:ABC-2 type transport system ATP-binding protein
VHDPVILTRDLRKAYGPHLALDGLDLEVPPGRVFGFLGPNGAGKTTTLNLLLGLARPTSGRAEVFGRDVAREGLQIRARTGFLAQEPRFYPHMTARETLAFVGRFFGLGTAREERRRIDAALDLVDLLDRADRPVGGFSGGERQRLGLAQAQIHEPALLILDEPAASLDPMGRRDVLTILERLKGRATVFFSTHILDDVQRVGDEVAILARGRRRAQAPVRELLAGDGGTFVVRLVGAPSGLAASLREEPWVRDVDAAREGGEERWIVRAADPERADRELLRWILARPEVRVHDYRRATATLEDVFVEIVEGDGRGRA